ncbi:MAG TPA: ATP-dependent DNA ligase [Sphingomicrobium sp.]|nr:ATP-dependent DNA ligase [Sphingomicrobium sp.]
MEALLAEELPTGPGWQYEPKWDGFRCIAARSGSEVELWSKSGKPLGRYFPEVAAMIRRLKERDFVIDGELLIVTGGAVSFDALQLRLHPADSRVRKLAAETPAMFMVFDCLASRKKLIGSKPLAVRRALLEEIVAKESETSLQLSPATQDRNTALGWLDRTGGALDGVIAKRLGMSYRPGERVMVKVKQRRTADCVVGGFRYGSKTREVGSLLLGLYDQNGLLNHVGFTSSIAVRDRAAWTDELEALIEPPGFTGNAPGGPSRWATERTDEWQPLTPKIVVEVLYDQVTAARFRHGTKLLRRRPDKSPKQCTMDQLAPPLTPAQLRHLMRT